MHFLLEMVERRVDCSVRKGRGEVHVPKGQRWSWFNFFSTVVGLIIYECLSLWTLILTKKPVVALACKRTIPGTRVEVNKIKAYSLKKLTNWLTKSSYFVLSRERIRSTCTYQNLRLNSLTLFYMNIFMKIIDYQLLVYIYYINIAQIGVPQMYSEDFLS